MLSAYCYGILPSSSFKHHWLLFSFYAISYQVLPPFSQYRVFSISPIPAWLPFIPLFQDFLLNVKLLIVSRLVHISKNLDSLNWHLTMRIYFSKSFDYISTPIQNLYWLPVIYKKKKKIQPFGHFLRLFKVSLFALQFSHQVTHPNSITFNDSGQGT